MRSGKILLVGGYGHVGTVLAHELAVRYPGQLIIAGRHCDRALALAATLHGGADAAQVDVRDEASVKLAAQHAQLMVNCSLDQRTPTLLRAAFANASAYLDIGANATALASARAGGAHTINVALLLSSRDAFGEAAIDFMLEALASPIRVQYQGQRMVLSAYHEHRHCEFPPPFGRKRACCERSASGSRRAGCSNSYRACLVARMMSAHWWRHRGQTEPGG